MCRPSAQLIYQWTTSDLIPLLPGAPPLPLLVLLFIARRSPPPLLISPLYSDLLDGLISPCQLLLFSSRSIFLEFVGRRR